MQKNSRLVVLALVIFTIIVGVQPYVRSQQNSSEVVEVVATTSSSLSGPVTNGTVIAAFNSTFGKQNVRDANTQQVLAVRYSFFFTGEDNQQYVLQKDVRVGETSNLVEMLLQYKHGDHFSLVIENGIITEMATPSTIRQQYIDKLFEKFPAIEPNQVTPAVITNITRENDLIRITTTGPICLQANYSKNGLPQCVTGEFIFTVTANDYGNKVPVMEAIGSYDLFAFIGDSRFPEWNVIVTIPVTKESISSDDFTLIHGEVQFPKDIA